MRKQQKRPADSAALARIERYQRESRKWIDDHPRASREERRRAMDDIARKLGA